MTEILEDPEHYELNGPVTECSLISNTVASLHEAVLAALSELQG